MQGATNNAHCGIAGQRRRQQAAQPAIDTKSCSFRNSIARCVQQAKHDPEAIFELRWCSENYATPAQRTTHCTCTGTHIAYSSPPPSPAAAEPKDGQNWDPAGDDRGSFAHRTVVGDCVNRRNMSVTRRFDGLRWPSCLRTLVVVGRPDLPFLGSVGVKHTDSVRSARACTPYGRKSTGVSG